MKIKKRLMQGLIWPFRLKSALAYSGRNLALVARWLVNSHETTNFTYHLTHLNRRYLGYFLGLVCNRPVEILDGYIREILDDENLSEHIVRFTRDAPRNFTADDEARYARRIGWYAIVRAIKPTIVIETGVDKGLGSCVLTAALMKNREQGYPGTYYGTDINPEAGYLFRAPYDSFGEIIYGDSIESLRRLDVTIELFINDSNHSTNYEMREFETVAAKLSPQAIIIGDNSHFSDELVNFAEKTNRDFLYWHEQPDAHWYPGGGIGAAFSRP